MILYIKLGMSKTIEISTDYKHTISYLKELISKRTKIPQSIMVLIFGGSILYDDLTILKSHIQNDSTLYLNSKFRRIRKYRFNVKTKYNSFRINMLISQSSLIEDIKCNIQDETGVPYESIHWYEKEKELDDKQSIIDINDIYDIECIIHDN